MVAMSRVEELVEQVRSLSPDEQEAFRLLLDSEGTDGFELSPAWKAEIKRRLEDIDSGRVKTIPWEDVQKQLEARLRGGSWD